MQKLRGNLLFSVVNYGMGEKFASLARNYGATGATIIPVSGSASNSILRALGLGDKNREAVLIVLEEEKALNVMTDACNDPKIKGISAYLGSVEDNMENTWKMITVIVNDGYSDDIMDTARNAGATGGTITHARGTAPVGVDNNFLGITIVPEKEMVMILTPSDKEEDIVNAISSMPCLQEPGVGVICVQDVKKFVNLGSEK